MSQYCLYRFYDRAGVLLYVGITMNPVARWRQHRHSLQSPYRMDGGYVLKEVGPFTPQVQQAYR